MSSFFENPIPIYAVGAVLITLCGLVFLNRRSLVSLVALVVACLGVLALVVLERLVVTDREQVEQAVAEIMLAIEQNDLSGVLALVDPAANQVRSDIEVMMPAANVTDTGFTSLEIEMNGGAEPDSAEARFQGKLDGVHKQSGSRIFYFDVVKLYWTKSGDRWLLEDYQPFWKGKPINAVGSMRGNRPIPAK